MVARVDALIFYVGLDIEYGGTIQHIHASDTDLRTLDSEYFQYRHADGVGPDGRADTEDARRLLAVRGSLPEEFRGELRAFMKVKDDDDALARFDVREPRQVFVLDDQRSLHIGYAPMPGDFLGVGARETDRLQLDPRVARDDVLWLPHHWSRFPPEGFYYLLDR